MDFKKLLKHLNIFSKCQKFGIPFWQCPQFLFLVMGVIIISVSIVFYLIGTNYYTLDHAKVALLVLTISIVLFIIFFTIIHNFERLLEVARMRSEFIDIASHHIRSPLTGLKWVIELLTTNKTKLTPTERKKYFNDAKESINLMVELIDDLLVVSRVEDKKFTLKKKEFFLEKEVEESIKRFRFFSDASKTKLNLHCENNLPKIFTDSYYLKLVIDSLVGNSISYTSGKGKIDIYLKKQKNNFLFKIKDNGVGIPQKDQKYIFQKFFRSENLLKEEIQGSGLGLYISKLIIKRLKGKIWFDSKEKEGTTFYFTIPIK
jgi:signal transduction histidine kinase